RRRLIRRAVARCAAVLPVGTANREYWEKYGAQSDQIFMAPYAIDNEAVARLAGERPRPDGPLRFVYAGRLIPRKGVDLLLQAFNRICGDSEASLDVIG